MRFGIWTSATVVALSMTAQVASSKEVKTLELGPSSNWQINSAEDSCQLARQFGNENNKHVLVFEQYEPGPNFSLTVSGPAFSKFTGRKPLSIQFGEQGHSQEMTGHKGELEPFGTALIVSTMWLEKHEAPASEVGEETQANVSVIDLASVTQLKNVRISQKYRAVRLLSGDLDKPLGALNNCSEELVRAWGFDPEKQKARTKSPKLTNAKYVRKLIREKYPSRAVRAGEQGIFRLRITIGADGMVEDCVLLGATEQKRLKSPACGIVKRSGEFEPALGADGEPMRSYYTRSIVYMVG